MKILLAGLAATLIAAPALAQTPAAEPAPKAAAPAAAKLTTKSPIKDLMANPKAKEILAKYASRVVAFFDSGQSEGLIPGATPLSELAAIPQAQEAGLTAENMKKIDEDLSKL